MEEEIKGNGQVDQCSICHFSLFTLTNSIKKKMNVSKMQKSLSMCYLKGPKLVESLINYCSLVLT